MGVRPLTANPVCQSLAQPQECMRVVVQKGIGQWWFFSASGRLVGLVGLVDVDSDGDVEGLRK